MVQGDLPNTLQELLITKLSFIIPTCLYMSSIRETAHHLLEGVRATEAKARSVCHQSNGERNVGDNQCRHEDQKKTIGHDMIIL